MSNVVSANKSITCPIDNINLASDHNQHRISQQLLIKRESQSQSFSHQDQYQIRATSNFNHLIDKTNSQQEACDCMLFANLNHSTAIVGPVSDLIHSWQCTTYHQHHHHHNQPQQHQLDHKGSNSVVDQTTEYNYSDINTVIINNNSNNHHYFAYSQTATDPTTFKYHNNSNDNCNKGIKRAIESPNHRLAVIATSQETTICKLGSNSNNPQNNIKQTENPQDKQEGGGGGGGGGGGEEEEEEGDRGSDEEDLNFDYEPVLAKILNEKKLALSNSSEVIKFLSGLKNQHQRQKLDHTDSIGLND